MLALGKQITSCGNQESIIWVCALKSCCSGPVLYLTRSIAWFMSAYESPSLSTLSNHLFICCTQCTCRSYLVPTNRVLIGYAACCPAPESAFFLSQPVPLSSSPPLSLLLLRSCLTSALQTILMIPSRFLTISGRFFGCHKSYDFFNVISFILPATPASPCPASYPPSHTPRKLASLLVLIARLLLGGAFWIL